MLYSFKPVTVGVHVSLGDICCGTEFVHFFLFSEELPPSI